MTITEARKSALARRFGTGCKITEYSWVRAMDDDLAGTFTLYFDDMDWIMKASGVEMPSCDVTTTVTSKTGINFSTNITADVYLAGAKIGATNSFIELAPGQKTFELRKAGYTTRTVTETLVEGSIMNRSYTLYASTEPTTPTEPVAPGATGVNFSTNVSASVYLNGALIGATSSFIEVSPGLKTFELRKPGYTTRAVTETVTAGGILNKTYTLYAIATETPETPGTPAAPVSIEGEGGVPLSITIVRDGLGNPITARPATVQVGVAQWFGIMVKNEQTTPWKGYTGVKFTDAEGNTWTHEPNKQYATAVAAGESKTIKTQATIPESAGLEGTIAITMLLRGFR